MFATASKAEEFGPSLLSSRHVRRIEFLQAEGVRHFATGREV